MKILHVDPAPSWRGGERQVFLLSRELVRRGHESAVVAAPHGPLLERLQAERLPAHAVPVGGDLDLVAITRLAGLMRRTRPDVVHLHTSRAHGAGGFAARLAGLGLVLVTRRVELPVRGPFSRWKYRHLADGYVAISGAVERALIDGGVEPSRIRRVPSGVEIPPERVPRRVGGPWTVGTLAAFTDQKDPQTWCRTVRHVAAADPEIRFVWAGEGEHRARVEVEIDKAGLSSRVELPGFLRDPEPLWRRLDAFFLPSAFEALGTVLLDAMVRGIPIVATRVGGVPEIVRTEREGILEKAGDDRGLGEALLRLRGEPELHRRLAEEGRRRAREFEIGSVVDRLESVYEELRRESR